MLQLACSIIYAWIGIVLVADAIVAATGDLPILVVGVALMLGLAGRAPFVGVRVEGAMFVRQGWWRTRRHPIEVISRVGVGPYTGWLAPWNRWGPTSSAAVTIKLDGDRVIELRELYGWASSMHRVANDINQALGLPVSDLPPQHRVVPEQK